MSFGVSLIPKRWPWPEILILLLAAVLRFTMLDLKPPHFDEGVNGWFADQMSVTGFYRYDPTNYHGPLHMYAVFLAQKLFGRDIAVLRLPAVLASLLAVWLMLRFGRFVGVNAARWAAAAMAVSPACVFYARYSIHESWLLAFLLLTAWGLLELWKNGSRGGLSALAGGVAGLILTKETYFIHFGCFALAAPCLVAWQWLSPSRPALAWSRRHWTAAQAGGAAFLVVFAIVFFYSGTFLNWPGVAGLYETYAAWGKTGMEQSGHAKTAYESINLFGFWTFHSPLNYYWIALLWHYEWPALIGLAACVRLLWPAPAQLRYLAIYGAGALVAYSIIPYKTPWLLLGLLWPFFFVFGAFVDELTQRLPDRRAAALPPFLAALAVALSMMMSARLNFVNFANPAEPYVYVQTSSEITRFTGPLLELVRRDPIRIEMGGQLMLDSYYPLPWMLGDFPFVAYPKETPDQITGDFVATEESKAARVEALLPEPYYRRKFRLRDAQEDCVAWFRASLFHDVLAGETLVGPAKPGSK